MLQGLIAPGDGAQRLQSHFRHGAFAERMLLPLENVRILDGLSSQEAARLTWLNTLLVPHGGLLRANLQPGQTVLINGASGHFGSAGVAVALAMGAECVIAVGRQIDLLQSIANRFGPRVKPVALSASETSDIGAVKQVADRPIDCMVDLLSPIRTFVPVRTAIMAPRPGGTVVLMGGVQADVAIPYSHVMRNNLAILGQYMYPNRAATLMVGLIRAGLLDLSGFNVEPFPLEKANEAVQHAAKRGGAFQQTVLVP